MINQNITSRERRRSDRHRLQLSAQPDPTTHRRLRQPTLVTKPRLDTPVPINRPVHRLPIPLKRGQLDRLNLGPQPDQSHDRFTKPRTTQIQTTQTLNVGPDTGNRRRQNPERVRAKIRTARPLERCFLHQAHTPTTATGYDTFRLLRAEFGKEFSPSDGALIKCLASRPECGQLWLTADPVPGAIVMPGQIGVTLEECHDARRAHVADVVWS